MDEVGEAGAGVQANDIYTQVGYDSLVAIVKAVSDASDKIIISELVKLLGKKEVAASVSKGVMPYLYAAGFLSFAARDINKETMSEAVSVMGITPDERIIDLLIQSGIKNHIVYVYSYYYLLAAGKNPTYEGIAKIVKMLGIEAEKEGIDETIAYIQSMK